jgi:deoxyribodipyrimidine photo-lyase
MHDKPIVLWFRSDLRLSDHAALAAAVRSGAPVLPLYIFDDASPMEWKMGGASRWWLAKSLVALSEDIAARGNRLILRRGDSEQELLRIVEEIGAGAVYFTRGYEPWAVSLETRLKSKFDDTGVKFRRFGGRLLREPEDMRTSDGGFYKVYTPFSRAFLKDFVPAQPIRPPERIASLSHAPKSERLSDWSLHPRKPDWSKGLAVAWQPGEAGARRRLADFSRTALKSYAHDRDYPAKPGTSRLSPHLALGEIAPSACWHAAAHATGKNPAADRSLETFLKELVWREFSYNLLFHVSDLPDKPFRKEYATFPWRKDAKHLKAWQRGQTGYPIIDAGMRELWATGYMHNRVRMIAASFLIKHLMLPWQCGEQWFWDTLVDADLANNSANWQWVAGSGADAAPYFRVFNPVLQGEKFDPEGDYVRRWVPELARLPREIIHAPWKGEADTLASAGMKLGKSYPRPIVDHGEARARALAAYERIRNSD